MGRPTFQGIRLIALDQDWELMRSLLPEALRASLDTSRDRYQEGPLPAYLGDPLNLVLDLSWGVEYKDGTFVVTAVDPNLSLTYERVREIETILELRKHPAVLVSPICQEGDTRTHGIIQRNHITRQYWDAGLVGPGTPIP